MAYIQNENLLAAVQQLLRQVGTYQLQQFRTMSVGAGDEKLKREFVSEVDINSEKLLISELSQLVPSAGFYGEETGKQGNQKLVWVIDPLDGTTNFLSGLDQFSISVALVENEKTVLGVVYKPASDEFFSASSSQSFQHNEITPSLVSNDLSLSQALIGTGFPYRSPDLSKAFFPAAESILYASRGIRRFGSAALDLSYLAAGYLQGFWESDLQPYDVAATLLFLEVRGCLVTNEFGQPFNMFSDRIMVAGWPGVHKELLPLVAASYS